MGITSFFKKKKLLKSKQKINEVHVGMMYDMKLESLVVLPATSISIFLCPNYPNCYVNRNS